MGMDLHGAGGYARCSGLEWIKVLQLAHEYGWESLGTEMDGWINSETGELIEPPDDWDGNYTSNDTQWVTEEDASRIADALEDALQDIPDRKVEKTEMEHRPVSLFDLLHDRTDPLEFFSGTGKRTISAVIKFCRAGGFRIA